MQQDHPPAPSFSPLASPWPEGGRFRRSETRSWGRRWQDGTPLAHPWASGDPPGLGELDRDPPKAGAAVISRGRGGGFLMRLGAEMNVN